MKDLKDYECDGQIELTDYLASLQQEKLRDKYPIPHHEHIRDQDWHYVDEELPEIDDVYCIITSNYVRCYRAFAFGKWHFWASHLHKWLPYWDDNTIAWAVIPSFYRMNDKHLPELLGLDGIIKCDTHEE